MVDSINLNNRIARDKVTYSGQICLGSVEYQVRIIDVSLNGLLAELDYDTLIPDYQDLRQALQNLPVIDLFLPELKVAGEANIVRLETIKSGFQLGIEFKHLSYHIDPLMFKRRVYRKNLGIAGQININDRDYNFLTEGISLSGMTVRIIGRVDDQTGSTCHFTFKQLDLQGEGQIIWLDRDYNSTLLGLQFVQKSKVDGNEVQK